MSGITSRVNLKSPDVPRRVLTTLAILLLVRFGFQVPVPGLSPEFVSQGRVPSSLFGLLSALSGGAIGQTPIFALGLLPWIAATILLWLCSSSRRGFERWRRIAVVPIAAAQALILYTAVFLLHPEMFAEGARHHPVATGLIVVLSLVAGAAAVMWLGEMIDKFGIGHGMLLIVVAGILARIPHAMNVIAGQEEFWNTILCLAGIWTITALVVTFAYVARRRMLSR